MNDTVLFIVVISTLIGLAILYTIIEDATKSKANAIRLSAIVALLMETARKQGVSEDVLKEIESTLPKDKNKKK